MRTRLVFAALSLMVLIIVAGCSDRSNTMLPTQNVTGLTNAVTSLDIPDGATIESATLFLYAVEISNETVNIYRVTSDWEEETVTWNSFGGAYDPAVWASFAADHYAWTECDVTDLVAAWLAGDYENFGLLLKQDPIPRARFNSKDAAAQHPFLRVCYTVDDVTECEDVYPTDDATLYEYNPDYQAGLEGSLWVGRKVTDGPLKMALMKFDFTVQPPPPPEGCTHTIGKWKNWAGFGPQDNIVTPLLPIWLGEPDGDKSIPVTDAATAVAILEVKAYGGNSNGIAKLYAQLLGAKLSLASGSDGSPVADAIDEADAFLSDYDWHDWGMIKKTDDKTTVDDWKTLFDDYNNGLLGVPHCD